MQDPPECGSDEKLCSVLTSDLCVSLADPSFGCADPSSCQQCPFDENSEDTSCSTEGKCALTCKSGFADCDSDPATCETDLSTPEACGACDRACGGAHVSESGCAEGSCTIESCSDGYFDRDKDPANGCESQDPCPIEPPSDFSSCDASAICAYEEEDACARCNGAYWDVNELDSSDCWDRPADCPVFEDTETYCADEDEGAYCCYSFQGEPRTHQLCNGDIWVKQLLDSYDDHCP